MAEECKIGDRVRLSGGFEPRPVWMGGQQSFEGKIVRFVPGTHEPLAAVVRLDTPISLTDVRNGKMVSGDVLVLELRFFGAQWKDSETVQIELRDSLPERKPADQRSHGLWVESHATYRVIKTA